MSGWNSDANRSLRTIACRHRYSSAVVEPYLQSAAIASDAGGAGGSTETGCGLVLVSDGPPRTFVSLVGRRSEGGIGWSGNLRTPAALSARHDPLLRRVNARVEGDGTIVLFARDGR